MSLEATESQVPAKDELQSTVNHSSFNPSCSGLNILEKSLIPMHPTYPIPIHTLALETSRGLAPQTPPNSSAAHGPFLKMITYSDDVTHLIHSRLSCRSHFMVFLWRIYRKFPQIDDSILEPPA
ncbi:hypothetical protein ACH5RR_001084 [Cinchona calisaya]|uniref:Uncharacterized protein n=1 Tax=Cinchona calisaya TaxID=153742 RepID=A0ABD3B327_9GENT